MRFRAILVGVTLTAGCAGSPGPAASRYPLHGQLLAVQLDTGELLVKHDAVPGYMDAMTMPFRVADRTAIRDRRPGDVITATLVIEGDVSYLEGVQAHGSAPLGDAVPPRLVAEGLPILAPGDLAPEQPLTTHRGDVVSFEEWHGAAVVVTFIYTRCPLPDYCPLLDRRFAAIQAAAADDALLGGRVHLLSVSFDPDADTPEVLAAHAVRAGAAAGWHFATAPRATVDRFAASFGVNVIREADRTLTHNLRTAVVGPDGRVTVLRSGNDWTADDVLADLRQALSGPITTR